jgi:hypothetical protein
VLKTWSLVVFAGLAALLPAPAWEGSVMKPELKPRTLAAFDAYMRTAETRLRYDGRGDFLWVDGSPERRRQTLEGKALAEPWTAKGEIAVPDGLIHDWVGAVFIPGATLEKTLLLAENYDNNKNVYKPEVVDSKLLSRDGDEFKVFLRLLKKKVLTVTLNTTYDVRYTQVAPNRWRADAYSTRIAEVENAGQSDEREMPPGQDHGFMWRLNSFWRYEERDGGVFVECEAISLTRDVPTGLGWLIDPIIRSVPKESLVNLLNNTRQALLGHPSR